VRERYGEGGTGKGRQEKEEMKELRNKKMKE
jgi:hypothetical protein